MSDSDQPVAASRAAIFGCSGPLLTDWEAGFFAEADPFGFILFARNCENPDQVRNLVTALRAAVGRDDAPVLIDQEGGRVCRLKPPVWREMPAPGRFGDLALSDRGGAREALELHLRLLAAELTELGVDVDCIPLLDLRWPEGHGIIGDRAFGAEPDLVAELGRVACEALLASGVMPVVKHIPGHGRATADSHDELPSVAASRRDLEATDFEPFRALADAPWGMTAHVLYSAIDDRRPATTSPRVVSEVIRGSIGFDGLLLSDDLSMNALEGDLGTRAEDALAAGCDVALHCNGERPEMEAVARATGPLSSAARRRVAAAAARLGRPEAVDRDRLRAQLDALLDRA